jgi:hypothetical protein
VNKTDISLGEKGGFKIMKFVYYNDTGRNVSIHPATITHGCSVNDTPIKPLEEREYISLG